MSVRVCECEFVRVREFCVSVSEGASLVPVTNPTQPVWVWVYEGATQSVQKRNYRNLKSI